MIRTPTFLVPETFSMSFQSSESALNSQSKPPPPPPFHPLSMSQIPPPPMLPVEPIHTDSSSTKENIPYVNKQDLYNIVYRDVLRKCDILNIGCYENKVWMNPVYPCLQVGPTCGLAVICMLANSMGKQLQLADLLFVSQACGFTKQGEMFSVANLKSLCNQVLGSNQLIIHHGTQGLEKDRKFIADHLKTGAVAFIPYDADYNHDCSVFPRIPRTVCGNILEQNKNVNDMSNDKTSIQP
ncbi:UPF0692 protein C19orf54 [Diaphorina citri]|uniref:Actin maturation protease n=1 Tax=Diaphorina citri TaxID=121845 RepID=A0A1S3DHX3_DIACI|nr:UPF0692 protein C19orf54 [Diaphorina citri]